MDKTIERRREERFHYQLPVWFADDFEQTTSQGVVIDISSSGMAFSCNADENCPYPGQRLTTRFSIPCFGANGSSATTNFTRIGRVCRVDNISNSLRHVAIQFDDPPPFWDIPPAKENQASSFHTTSKTKF